MNQADIRGLFGRSCAEPHDAYSSEEVAICRRGSAHPEVGATKLKRVFSSRSRSHSPSSVRPYQSCLLVAVSIVQALRGHLLAQIVVHHRCPDESSQFTGHGCGRLGHLFALRYHLPSSSAEPALCLPGLTHDSRRLPRNAFFKSTLERWMVAVMPRCLCQSSADM